MTTNIQSNQTADAAEREGRESAAKWAILLNDELFPMPRRKLLARDILDQCGVTRDFVLQRDHGDTHDVIFDDDKEVDLTHGNVFVQHHAAITPVNSGRMSPRSLRLS